MNDQKLDHCILHVLIDAITEPERKKKGIAYDRESEKMRHVLVQELITIMLPIPGICFSRIWILKEANSIERTEERLAGNGV